MWVDVDKKWEGVGQYSKKLGAIAPFAKMKKGPTIYGKKLGGPWPPWTPLIWQPCILDIQNMKEKKSMGSFGRNPRLHIFNILTKLSKYTYFGN